MKADDPGAVGASRAEVDLNPAFVASKKDGSGSDMYAPGPGSWELEVSLLRVVSELPNPQKFGVCFIGLRRS